MPSRLVVLTFDDACRSDLEHVAPLLKDRGFGATFFVTQAYMDGSDHYVSWGQIAELHRLGFEIGNHSWSHVPFHTAEGAALLDQELGRVEAALAEVGVPRPVSFSWPGNHFGPEAVGVLRERGYLWARRGPMPDVPAPRPVGIGPLYQPSLHDPLLVPTSGLATPQWDLDDFRDVVDRAGPGKIAVLQFHGVPDVAHPSCSTTPRMFEEFVDHLEAAAFTVIGMRDLARYIDPKPRPDDPMAQLRFFR